MPSDFGVFLKEKRIAANLTQDELASVIEKTGQYISNIEKGKNSAPPKEKDIDALISKLGLSGFDAKLFQEKAAADRNRLPHEQMEYIFNHQNLKELIAFGTDNKLSDKCWAELLAIVSGRKQK